LFYSIHLESNFKDIYFNQNKEKINQKDKNRKEQKKKFSKSKQKIKFVNI